MIPTNNTELKWRLIDYKKKDLMEINHIQMDRTTISAARHRKERLKACGNAIVPACAIKIIQGIRETENKHKVWG
jgi:hypothetical protein